jgi:DNA-binding NarL/FixJ family response regulator
MRNTIPELVAARIVEAAAHAARARLAGARQGPCATMAPCSTYRHLSPKSRDGKPRRGARLSLGEIAVLRLIAGGLSDQVIAERLTVTMGAVAHFRWKLCEKTGAANRVQLARYAMSEGYVSATWAPPSAGP